MSLLVISHSYMSGENQKNIVALARYLDIRVALPETFKSTVFKQIRAGVIPGAEKFIRIFKTIHLPRSQFILKPLMLDLRDTPTHIINVEYDPWSVMFWQAIAARRLSKHKAKIVCTVKNNTYTAYPGPLGKMKRAVAMKGIAAVDLFLASSEMVARLYQEQFGVPKNKLAVCPHLGVDSELFSPGAKQTARTDGKKLVVGYCGRLDEDKGVLDLIDAVKACRRQFDLELHLLGNGKLRDKIVQLKKENPWIKIFDPVPHDKVPEFLQGLDIFVLPSRVSPDHEEHDAHALVEAMSVGLPCIGTQSGITPELITPEDGFLVPANSSEELAGALAKLAGEAGLRNSLGRNAREKMLEEHAIDALARRKADIFRRLGAN